MKKIRITFTFGWFTVLLRLYAAAGIRKKDSEFIDFLPKPKVR